MKIFEFEFISALLSFLLLWTLEMHGEVTNNISTELNQPKEAAFAGIMAARAELDKELLTDPNKLNPQEFETARKMIVKQTAQLSKTASDFVEKFPTNDFIQVSQQQIFSIVLLGMLQKQHEAILGNIAEFIPGCLFQTETCEHLHLSVEQASQMQSTIQSAFADAVITALKFKPESYNGVYMFMKRANPDAGQKLARVILNDPATDASLKQCASFVLNRKFTVGKPLILKFPALDGRQVDIAKMRGKVVLVDFWATDCVPCMEKLPALELLYQKYHDRGFEVVSISTDSDQEVLLRVIQEKAISWPVYKNLNGWTNKFVMECGVNAIPDYWLIDSKGIIREIMAASNLEKKIEFLLAYRRDSPTN
jgi:thiol-disulfide isomerase/thioredoxin